MKIGIITMHNVINYGSALQAYALQHTLELNGIDCEIIDYNLERKPKKLSAIVILKILLGFIKNAVTGFSQNRSRNRFLQFRNTYLNISKNSYNKNNIGQDKLDYDIYMTGSDQVWNPKHIGDDVNYFLAFAPLGAPKISYASSFAATYLDDSYKLLYSKYLAQYSHISVRENSGKELVKQMVNKDAVVDIDPVLLLNAKEWTALAEKSCLSINTKYILVYALYYMFDPYPELKKIINHVQNTLNCKVIYLNARTFEFFMPNSRIYKAGGPNEFLYLIKNAEVVITTSFHGTAFSVIFGKPLISIVKGDNSDDRLCSLLSNLNSKESIVAYNTDISEWDAHKILSLKSDQVKLKELNDTSKFNLLNSIKNYI